MSISVKDNTGESRFEILDGEELVGLAQYRLRPNQIAFVHTETEPDRQGEGLASRLIRRALDSAAERGLAVLPFCPFVRSFIDDHRSYLLLVPEDRRGAFGLPDQASATADRDVGRRSPPA